MMVMMWMKDNKRGKEEGSVVPKITVGDLRHPARRQNPRPREQSVLSVFTSPYQGRRPRAESPSTRSFSTNVASVVLVDVCVR